MRNTLILATLAILSLPTAAFAQAYSVTPIEATSGYVHGIYGAVDLNNCGDVAIRCPRVGSGIRESGSCLWNIGEMELLPDPAPVTTFAPWMDLPSSINDRGDIAGGIYGTMMGNAVVWPRGQEAYAFPSPVRERVWPALDPMLRMEWVTVGSKISNERDVAFYRWGTLDGEAVDRQVKRISKSGVAAILEKRGPGTADVALLFSVPTPEGRREVEAYSTPGIMEVLDVTNDGKALVSMLYGSSNMYPAVIDMNTPNVATPVLPADLMLRFTAGVFHMNRHGMFTGTSTEQGGPGILVIGKRVFPMRDLLPSGYASLVPFAINDRGEILAGYERNQPMFLLRPTPAFAETIGVGRYNALLEAATFLDSYCERLRDPGYSPTPADYLLPVFTGQDPVGPPTESDAPRVELPPGTPALIPLGEIVQTGRVEKVSGLPKGLKFDKKRQRIYGKPRRTGSWTVRLKIGKGRSATTSSMEIEIGG